MRFVDLSAPIEPSPPGDAGVPRRPASTFSATRTAPPRSRRCSACRRGCCATARAGRSRRSRASARTTRPTSTRRGTTTRRSAASARRRSTSCRSTWFFAPGVVLDFTAKEDGDAVTRARRWSRRSPPRATSCAPRDIVLVRTGRDALLRPSSTTWRAGRGVTAEATRWLFEQGRARDGHRRLGLGRARCTSQAEEAEARDEPGIFWAAHQAELPYSQIERLVNLRRAAADRASRSPASRCGSSAARAAPARVVAILDD